MLGMKGARQLAPFAVEENGIPVISQRPQARLTSAAISSSVRVKFTPDRRARSLAPACSFFAHFGMPVFAGKNCVQALPFEPSKRSSTNSIASVLLRRLVLSSMTRPARLPRTYQRTLPCLVCGGINLMPRYFSVEIIVCSRPCARAPPAWWCSASLNARSASRPRPSDRAGSPPFPSSGRRRCAVHGVG